MKENEQTLENCIDPALVSFTVLAEDIALEKKKARKLRHSTWWKRKCSQGRCYYCAKSCAPQALTMDHIVPLSKGGHSTKINIATACKECNNAKKSYLPTEWTA